MNKHTKRNGLLFTLVLLFLSCTQDSSLEIALQKAKTNRPEIEKVLEYFSRSPKDSLKYKAACFLIENMPGHVSHQKKYSLKKGLPWNIQLFSELVSGLSENDEDTKEDIEVLTSDFLIAHIESVFRQKERYLWLHEIDFTDFCEYLLPYNVEKEIPGLWRDSTITDLQLLDNHFYHYDDMRTSIGNISNELAKVSKGYCKRALQKIYSVAPRDISCQYEALSEMILHRSCGIPAAFDIIPCWGNYNGWHTWVQPIERINHHVNQIEVFHRSIPKVYRKTYSRQSTFGEKITEEYVPDFFRNEYLKDVTNEYVNGVEVVINRFPGDATFGYLCVFNEGEWKPVSQAAIHSGKCIFTSMGPGIVYLPVYYDGDSLGSVAVSLPFILRANGEIKYLQSSDKSEDMTLYRKYTMESRKKLFMEQIVGCRLEAAKSEHSERYDTLCTIQQNLIMQPLEIPLENHSYHYFKIIPPEDRSSILAEIYFFDEKGKRKNGVVDGFALDKTALTDNDPLTSTYVYNFLSFTFLPTDTIAAVHLIPFNDANGIYPGDEYELFRFDKSLQWVSCGKKKADAYRLEYQQLPQGGLYWLRNLTCGKEERIFTYENGKQRFW